MIIEQIPVRLGELEIFSYLIACPDTKEGIIIDPAAEIPKIMNKIKNNGVKIKYIVNTHAHPDHIAGNKEMKILTGAKIVLHEADVAFFQTEEAKDVFRTLGLFCLPEADILVKDKDILEMGTLKINIIHTPGHTPGSICVYINGNLFTGDTLFVGAVGRTDLPGGSFEQLLDSIKEKILPLPDETIIWPGHGYEGDRSTLAKEKQENLFITEFILGN
ncbi:MAG: hypothetical protein AMJ45_06640 [Syntrophobacter sp. DG_60]|nr:MAG: hypothetical protein AMJ45_06640 [Syntrophobacter sp. DG_60]